MQIYITEISHLGNLLNICIKHFIVYIVKNSLLKVNEYYCVSSILFVDFVGRLFLFVG